MAFRPVPCSGSRAEYVVLEILGDPTSQGSLHFEVVVYQYSGGLDVERFNTAFQAMVDRHAALRTSFIIEGGDVMAQVHYKGSVQANLEQLDLLHMHVDSPDLSEKLNEVVRRPFNLQQPPLARLTLVHLAEKRHVLMLSYSRCIMDIGSQTIWNREFEALYKLQNLPPLTGQVTEGAELRSLRPQTKSQANELIKSCIPLDLPLDYPRPKVALHLGHKLEFTLPTSIHDGLHSFMSRERQALLPIMLAAYAFTLGGYSRQDDVIVAVSIPSIEVSNQKTLDIYNDLLPVRVDINKNEAFSSLLEQVCRSLEENILSKNYIGAYEDSQYDEEIRALTQAVLWVSDAGKIERKW